MIDKVDKSQHLINVPLISQRTSDFNPVQYGGVFSGSKQNVTAESLEEEKTKSKKSQKEGSKIAQCST